MSTENIMQRRMTTAFINTRPVTITLTPRTKQAQDTGGYKWVDGAARQPQTMRLVEPPSAPVAISTNDGEQRQVEFLLIAEPDAAIEENDTFSLNGHEWQILDLYPDNGYEVRAKVVRRG